MNMHASRIARLSLVLALAPFATGALAQEKGAVPAPNVGPPAHQAKEARFEPPAPDAIPNDEFGKVVRRGRDLFVNTQQLRGKYVGNGLNCANCHLDAGRLANSAPMWAAYVLYPKYRGKNKMVNTMIDRVQGCFKYSENGKPPPADSEELTAMISYMYWLAGGAPTGKKMAGQGYPKLEEPAQKPDIRRGAKVYAENCAVCHGENGQGQKVNGTSVFPPLWGKDAYNWGAGMHRINTAASFIKYNMPFGKANPTQLKAALSDQEAWDVAAYVNSHERPQDPRYQGNLQQTEKQFHDHQCYYGHEIGGQMLGAKAYPNPLKTAAAGK